MAEAMRQVNITSLGDDARETLTIAGLEGQGTISGTTLTSNVLYKPGQCCVQVWVSTCERRGLEQSAHANGNWCRDVNVCLLWQSWTRESEVSIPQCQVQQLWQDWTSQSDVQTTCEICWQVKSLEQQWQEFWQRRHEPWKHRRVPLLWTGRPSTT